MALLVILMIVGLMTGIGLITAQSAMFEVRSAGFVRRAVQTSHMGDAASEIVTHAYAPRAAAYQRVMRENSYPDYVIDGVDLAPEITPFPDGVATYPPTTIGPDYWARLTDVFAYPAPLPGRGLGVESSAQPALLRGRLAVHACSNDPVGDPMTPRCTYATEQRTQITAYPVFGSQ